MFLNISLPCSQKKYVKVVANHSTQTQKIVTSRLKEIVKLLMMIEREAFYGKSGNIPWKRLDENTFPSPIA